LRSTGLQGIHLQLQLQVKDDFKFNATKALIVTFR